MKVSENSGASFINTKVTNPNFQFAVKTKSTGDEDKTTYEFIHDSLRNHCPSLIFISTDSIGNSTGTC